MAVDARLRIGVVGIGYGQQVHVPAFRRDPRCQVAAICASTRERAQRVAARLGIGGASGDWRELVEDPDIDAVTIATPPSLQPVIALAALSRGKAVFCEKPLALSAGEAQELAEAADREGLANMVGLEFPEVPEWQRARALLDQGAIGALRHVAVSWYVETYVNRVGLRSWKTEREAGGGALNSFVAHTFHYIEWLAGPIGRLSASLRRAADDPRSADTVDALCLETAGGVPVSVSVSSHAFLGHGHRVELYGEQGTLVLDNPTSDYVAGFRLLHGTRESPRLEPAARTEATPACDGRIEAVSRLASRFATWALEGVPARPDFRDGLRVQRLLDAARRSDSECRWVAVPVDGEANG